MEDPMTPETTETPRDPGGAPKRYENLRQLYVSIEHADYERLRQASRDRWISISDIVRLSLKETLTKMGV